MAVYRTVYTTFWQDDFILSLTSTEKFFYLYLMTNSKTNICGIYELPKSVAMMETGLPLIKITELLTKFEKEYHRVVCSKITNEIVVTNWLKYNGNPSPKVQKAIQIAFENVKDKSLINFTYGNIQNDTVSKKNDTVSKNIEGVSPSDCSMFSDNDTVSDTVPVIVPSSKTDYKPIIESWNQIIELAHIDCIEHKRLEHVKTRIEEKGFDRFLQMIENVKVSPFLLGKIKDKDGKAFKATFDWCILPNNFQKILDGNYIEEENDKNEKGKRPAALTKIYGERY